MLSQGLYYEDRQFGKFMSNRIEGQEKFIQQDSDNNYEWSTLVEKNRQTFGRFDINKDHENSNKWEQRGQEQLSFQFKHKNNKSIDDQDENIQNQEFEDSFLNLVDDHLQNLKKKTQNIISQDQKQSNFSQQLISLSKKQVCHCLLQNQKILDIVQLTNLFPTKCVAQIIYSPFQFRLLNAKNKFIRRDQVEIILQPYESVEIQFEIKKRQSEIGNIYQTLRIDTSKLNQQKPSQKSQPKFLNFQITFVKPKLQVNFLGRMTVKRIHQHKIGLLEIYPNAMGQYFLNLIFTQDQCSNLNSSRLQKIQCQIEAKGYVSIHPNSVLLYQDQPLKILLRQISKNAGVGKTSVVLIKPLKSQQTYVIGVKCMERMQKSLVQEQKIKNMNKFML